MKRRRPFPSSLTYCHIAKTFSSSSISCSSSRLPSPTSFVELIWRSQAAFQTVAVHTEIIDGVPTFSLQYVHSVCCHCESGSCCLVTMEHFSLAHECLAVDGVTISSALITVCLSVAYTQAHQSRRVPGLQQLSHVTLVKVV